MTNIAATDLFPTSRNAVLLTAGQSIAMAAGFAAQIMVARILLPAGYGSFAVALSVLAWVELLVTSGFTLSLAQAVSVDQRNLGDAIGWVKRTFVPYAFAVCAIYSAGSNLIAVALGDSRLTQLLLVAGLELPSIAVFAAARDLLMGVGAAGRQAGVISVYALLRALCIVMVAAFTRSSVGALAGNALAALAAAGFAIMLLSNTASHFTQIAPRSSFGCSLSKFVLKGGVPILLLVLLTQMAVSIDLWSVKRLVRDQQAVGYYAAGRFLAFVPYMLATGLNLALFPAVCRELGRGDRLRALSLTREALRLLFLCLIPFCAIVLATASSLVHLLLSQEFSGAALPAGVLSIGLCCFSIVGTLQTVIIADGRPLFNCIVMALLSGAVFFLCGGLVPAYGPIGAAWAVASTGAAGAALLGIYVARRLGSIFPLACLFRAIVASACIWVAGSVWYVEGPWLVGQYLVFVIVYALILLAIGEITRGDLTIARHLAARLVARIRSPRGSLPD